MKILINLKNNLFFKYIVKTLKSHWIFILSFFCFSFLLIYGYKFGYLYGIVDSSFPEINLDVSLFDKYFYWWGHFRGYGELQSVFSSSIFEYFYLKIIHIFTKDMYMINFLKIYVLNLIYLIVTYLALFSFKFNFEKKIWFDSNKLFLVLISLISVFNLYFIQSNQTILFIQRFDYIIFCLIIILINNYEKYYSRALILLVFFVSNGTWHLFPYWLPYLLVLFLYTSYLLSIKKINLRSFVILWALYFLINIPGIVSLGYYILNLNYASSNSIEYANQVFLYANSNSSLDNVMSFIGGVNWNQNWNWINEKVFLYNDLFTKNWYFVLIRFLPFLLFVYLLIYKKTKDALSYLLLVIILFYILMITANNLPFGSIYSYLFEHNILFKLYRESHNKFYPVTIFLILLFIYQQVSYLNKKYMKSIICIIFLYLFSFVFVIFNFTFYSQQAFFKIPNDYIEVSKFIDQRSLILVLPQFSQIHSYSYNHFGTSPIQYSVLNPNLIPYSIIESESNNKLVNNILNNFNYQKSETALNRGSINPNFDTKLLVDKNINYIILDSYVNGPPDFSVSDFDYLKKKIDESKDYTFYKKIGGLFLYVKNIKVPVVMSNQNLTYSMQNSGEFLIEFGDPKVERTVTLLQNYNKGWVLVAVDKNKVTLDCKNAIYFTKYYSKQCESNKDLWLDVFFGEKIKNSHINDNENSWKITNEYEKNNDFIIYYKPQIYYNISIFLSFMFLIFGIFLIKK